MMKPFLLTVKAKADLKEIARFTQRRWGKEQRNLYLKQFDLVFQSLADNPESGKASDYIRTGYRKCPQGSHIIYYQQTAPHQIRVIRILHQSMDINSAFD
jgi:toxin ParE1/3/4